MYYENLENLIDKSKSARAYFLSLPVKTQMQLHGQGAYIRTAAELRLHAEAVRQYEKMVLLGEWSPNKKEKTTFYS